MNMETQIEAFFWICAALLAYVYIGYPLLIGFLAILFPRPADSRGTLDQTVSLLISAYNEGPVIAAKLENTLALDFAEKRLEVIVISDCSDDATDEIVRGYADRGVRLLRQNQRLGKSAALNFAVPQASGEILLFSDANAMYQPDAVQQLVRHFASPRVGYVVGNARYYEKGTETPSAESEGLYWKFETYLKKRESLFGSVVGGDGAIYAIRRELFTPLLPTDINDFLNPLQIIVRGYIGVFEPLAICYEEAADSFSQEFRRKVRIISRSLNALRRIPAVLNPLKNPRHWFLLVSHKLLRWFAPFFMILLFAASITLWRFPFYRAAALLQSVFYGLALVGWKWEPKNKIGKISSLPFYFCLVNLASLIGCLKCFRGDLSAQWAPPRQKLQSHI
jgi:cellulose synthase/poly-beta-1,6-N-acetylglucosamine synthase-like glycosyltransferase